VSSIQRIEFIEPDALATEPNCPFQKDVFCTEGWVDRPWHHRNRAKLSSPERCPLYRETGWQSQTPWEPSRIVLDRCPLSSGGLSWQVSLYTCYPRCTLLVRALWRPSQFMLCMYTSTQGYVGEHTECTRTCKILMKIYPGWPSCICWPFSL
jgi:hypothetical protein